MCVCLRERERVCVCVCVYKGVCVECDRYLLEFNIHFSITKAAHKEHAWSKEDDYF